MLTIQEMISAPSGINETALAELSDRLWRMGSLPELKTAFENVLQSFPEFTVFQSDNSTYYDIVNFLQNTRFPVQDERLKCIEPQERKEMVVQLHERLNLLEALTEPVWGECAECSGWKPVMDDIEHIFNQEEKTWV